MKTYFIIIAITFSSLLGFSQKLVVEKASPFTAVKWENDQPIVQFEAEWYDLEKIEVFSKEQLLNFCKKQYGSKWQKRFSEDLVEVLKGLNHQPEKKVVLQLSKNGISTTFTGTFTNENRNSLLAYNRAVEKSIITPALPQKISTSEAVADLQQFEELLKSASSYSQLSRFDFKTAIKKISDSIIIYNQHVDVNTLTNEMAKVMSEIGDRHSSINNEGFDKKNHQTYNLKLPFGVATINGKIVALKKNVNNEDYRYYHHSYPYLKSINGVAATTLIEIYNYRDKRAPLQAKLSRGASAIQKFGALLFENNLKCMDSVTVVFSDGKTDNKETFLLTTAKDGYISKLRNEQNVNGNHIIDRNFDDLSKILSNHIGYFSIPEMYNYDHVEGLEDAIIKAFKSFENTKALIIDIRNNPGGGRELLQTFAGYVVQAKQSPWIANVAYLRTDENITGDEELMTARYLYSYNSNRFSNGDRKAIDQFSKDFKPEKLIDYSKFSSPFYMVLHHGKETYRQPVYILVNEGSFSAASVFASAFKSLPNVKIVGETTDGSSGNSRIWHLKNSNIKVSISTMLSFQRNGKTLDGNGTIPDIVIEADENQVLHGYDTQLNKLISLIHSGEIK